MHHELVVRRRWISEARFLHALDYCMVLPGPEAQQLATYIGWLMHRTAGGIAAGVLFVLPSLGILIGLSWVYLASVVTFFTFLPSFLFILLGGPLIESTHGNVRFTAPLTAITAAVVGVIVDLAVFFAGHVLWPRGAAGGFDLPAAVLCVAPRSRCSASGSA